MESFCTRFCKEHFHLGALSSLELLCQSQAVTVLQNIHCKIQNKKILVLDRDLDYHQQLNTRFAIIDVQ